MSSKRDATTSDRPGRSEVNRDRIALGIRQPWAELILRGIKTIEVRTLPARARGPIYLYASKQIADIPAARDAIERHGLDAGRLVTGRLVGTVEIVACRPCTRADVAAACVPATLLEGKLGWVLANPQRLDEPLPVRFLPYGVWFYPFRRRNGKDRPR